MSGGEKKPIDLAAIPGGASVRLVVRGRGELYGDVAGGARLGSERICVVLWGCDGRSVLARASEIEAIDVVTEPKPSLIASVAKKQRAGVIVGSWNKKKEPRE